MFKHLLYKEWIKIRWPFLASLLICIGLVVNLWLQVRSTFIMDGGVSTVGNQLYAQMLVGPYYGRAWLEYGPLITGLAIGVSQYLPEVMQKRVKLTLHLPAEGTKLVYQMVIIGFSAVLSVMVVLMGGFWLVSAAFFPPTLALAGTATVGLCALGAITTYFFIAMIAMEPAWLYKVLYAFPLYVLANLYFQRIPLAGMGAELYPVLLTILAVASVSILFTTFRFSRGER